MRFGLRSHGRPSGWKLGADLIQMKMAGITLKENLGLRTHYSLLLVVITLAYTWFVATSSG